MGNGIAEEVAVAFKVVDGGIWSCDDAVAVAGFFFLLWLGAHCDVDDDIWSVFGSRVGGADDLEEVNGLAGLVFFSLFREKQIIRLSAPTKHPK